MTKINYLKDISESKKPFIIYKTLKGFNLYTDFSKRIILTNKNIKNFINKTNKNKKKIKETDIFLGFFGYEILNNLIGIKIKKQKGLKFPRGIFYKPETLIKLSNKLKYISPTCNKSNKVFKINLSKVSYENIFDRFKKKIKSGETYQIKICTKYKNKSKIDPLDFFCRLTKTNMAPEAFMIKDKNYSIISCSPENLITKKKDFISIKPIAGTLKKFKSFNKNKALEKKPRNIIWL